ncbi:MAG TPA: tRNA uridine-5-carboxymethylaminomethyl(34) synthesis enzyme MnmG [Gemmatimonadales bacterium]|nr:tRNA uridine-5-carboxymethylaminomethyl(34) synthesis enzyme MnmG [Gemmatimonadales bacterium]
MSRHDVIVIGGGHAGAEAAVLAARSGARTLLITQNLETIGQMSCNPAIGGIAKGTVVREIDALGGIMGRATDQARIQFRMLNRSKGPAVWSPRAQCDRGLYRRAVRGLLERHSLLETVQGTVASLLLKGQRVDGVTTVDGRSYYAVAVVLTAGTFLRGRIHLGTETRIPAGRAGDAPAIEFAEDLQGLGLRVARFKTGTPPRIDGRTVKTATLHRQDGDDETYWFSNFEKAPHPAQLPCWLTWSGSELKEIIGRHLRESALYGGAISGRGPRYCPSIEDKIVKFPDAERHQIFLEPEGLDTSEMYVNGLSTSLPPDVQLEFLRTIPGLEAVRMTRPGYAIEYDYYPPTQLSPTLEYREIDGFFLAGQVNGTTGYEEAAGQGVVAGINAAAKALGREPVVFRRDEAFIGVLVDDLVSRGVDEPYRLFTSRSEYRLLLRQDNALRRLLPRAEAGGYLSEEELALAHARLEREEKILAVSRETSIEAEAAEPILSGSGSTPILDRSLVADLARRPGVDLRRVLHAAGVSVDEEDVRWADLELKYEGYMRRERAAAERIRNMEGFVLPELDYAALGSLSYEAREKLNESRPATLGQASRIPGVSPSDLQALVLESTKWRFLRASHAPTQGEPAEG